MGRGTMEEMLIIPRAEAPELVQKHSAMLMEDGRLSHAARLAARQERLLNDPTLPDDVAVERVKPVDRKLRRAVKKLRQLQTQPCLLYTSPSPRDLSTSRMPSSA